jgi:hypothetical protein
MDFSEHERRTALEVIDAFKEQDTRDELGVGSIRDAFPTSCFQAQARFRHTFGTFFSCLGHISISSAAGPPRIHLEIAHGKRKSN